MVATKYTPHGHKAPSAPSNNVYESYEIRSGMSVQDLKHLTAQRQCLEFWARSSPRQQPASKDWGAVSSPSSTCSSSGFSASPPRQFGSPYTGGYPPPRRGLTFDKMFVTCGGQVVSFMAGVVNAPLGDV